MDLNYTPEDIAFRKRVRAWLEREPAARADRARSPERRVWHRKLYEAGYLGMGWPQGSSAAAARGRWSRPSSPTRWRGPTRRRPINGLGLGIDRPDASSSTAPRRRSSATSRRS